MLHFMDAKLNGFTEHVIIDRRHHAFSVFMSHMRSTLVRFILTTLNSYTSDEWEIRCVATVMIIPHCEQDIGFAFIVIVFSAYL